jgi:hypothetical protein
MSSLTPVDLDSLAQRHRIRLGLEVLASYLRVRRVMHDEDAERAVKRLRESAGANAPQIAYQDGTELLAAWRLGRIVRRVLSILPSDSRCLYRSLTLVCMLQRRGIAHTLVIAVRPRPFAAHAWVEVEGQAMLPDADPGYERLVEL